jgi:hypothetical protein
MSSAVGGTLETELYENGDEDRPIEPKLNMALGDENITKIQHSTYVKSLCTLKNMQEMESARGWNSKICRQFVCPNHEKAPLKKSKSRNSESESTTMPPTSSTQPQCCPVELKLTYTFIPNNRSIKKWHVAKVCWEHAEFCEYGKGIKNPSTKVINTILRTCKDTKDAKSQEETIKILKNLGIETGNKLIKVRIKNALKSVSGSQKSSTTSSTTSSSLVRDKQVFLFNYYYSYVMQKNM